MHTPSKVKYRFIIIPGFLAPSGAFFVAKERLEMI